MQNSAPVHTYVTQLRQARGWSMSELSRYAGVPQATLSRLEGGQTDTPSLDTLRKLAAALGVPEQDLIDRAGHAAPPGQPAPASLDVLAAIHCLLLEGVSAGQWSTQFAEPLYALLLAHAQTRPALAAASVSRADFLRALARMESQRAITGPGDAAGQGAPTRAEDEQFWARRLEFYLFDDPDRLTT